MKNYTRLLFLAGILLYFFDYQVLAQTDTEFWFVAPEVSSGHGDRPITFRMATLDKSAQITIAFPANPSLAPIQTNIAANSAMAIDMSNYQSSLETTPAANVLNTGIRITSTAPISCYYEVNSSLNSDIFTLKGKNALGNEFLIPGQNVWTNGNYNPTPYSSFDIVATENNTVVTITPSRPVVGFSAGETFLVKLNRGQTYSVRAISQDANGHLSGSEVVSNKPVAITIKDDSMGHNGCFDLMGDQIVPIKVTGKEYVVTKGFLFSGERFFITATEDNTKVFINGSNNPEITLNRGQTFGREVFNASTFISATAPIYVLHLTGFGCELGGSLLPSINCNGSFQIGFTRSTSDFFGMMLLVRKEGRGNFRVNGNTSYITTADFQGVPGTNDEWYYAQKSMTNNQIITGSGNLISNSSHSFQLGIINGDAQTACRYGYFSAFASLFIGDDIAMCEGNSRVLDAGPGKDNYLWSTGDTTQKITVTEAGEYWVRVLTTDCELRDTVKVRISNATVNLGSDRLICPNDTLILDPGLNYFSYLWSNGSIDRYLTVSDTGNYWVEVRNFTGCVARDTIHVGLVPTAPTVSLGSDLTLCPRETVTFDVTNNNATYLWQNGSTLPLITVSESGIYWVKVAREGCVVADSVTVTFLDSIPLPTIDGTASVCPAVTGISYRFDTLQNDLTYQWLVSGGTIFSGQGTQEIKVDWGGSNPDAKVQLLVLSNQGCPTDTITFPVRINVELNPETPQGLDIVCFNEKDGQVYTTRGTAGSIYTWEAIGGTVVAGQGTAAATVNWDGTGSHQIRVFESSTTLDTVCNGVSQFLDIEVFKDEAVLEMHVASWGVVPGLLGQVDDHFLQWGLSGDTAGYTDSLTVFRRLQDETSWEAIARIPRTDTILQRIPAVKLAVHEYRLGTTNHCGEEIFSPIHHTILLEGSKGAENDMVSLTWNAYQGWPQGVGSYEIWRKLDDQNEYVKMGAVDGSTLAWSGEIGADGFIHDLRVKAIEAGGKYVSWSNDISLEFEHELFFPNVFTPNRDGKNDVFEIVKLELFPDNELTVYNRWGEEVYHQNNYQNTWDADGISDGTYYYIFTFNKPDKGTDLQDDFIVKGFTKTAKGFVQILRGDAK